MSERIGVEHLCKTPGRLVGLLSRPWTCPYCRRVWTPERDSAWRSVDDGTVIGEVVGFTMRYPDGSTQNFGKPPPPAPRPQGEPL